MRPTELRGVLQYVPKFRDKFVVLCLDAAVVMHPNFANLLVDIAVMRSLNIQVGIVHGAGGEMDRIARESNLILSDLVGSGITDAVTLDIAVQASNRISQTILEGLASVDLKGAITNAVEAHPVGILKGIDHQFSGKIERVDSAFFHSLLQNNIIPVVPCITGNGQRALFRINSDQAAYSIAVNLNAIKIIFLTQDPGLVVNGELVKQISSSDVEELLGRPPVDLSPSMTSKLRFASRACKSGISRVHLINGTHDGDLLHEIFSPEGIGTLIYSNDYQQIRQATKVDVRALMAMTQAGVEADELIARSRKDIEEHIGDYYIFISNGQIVGCVAFHVEEGSQIGELAYLFVHPDHENQGIGKKLVKFVEEKARQKGLHSLVALSTQTFSYFVQKGGFIEGGPDDLPSRRKSKYFSSGRKSKVLIKHLVQS